MTTQELINKLEVIKVLYCNPVIKICASIPDEAEVDIVGIRKVEFDGDVQFFVIE